MGREGGYNVSLTPEKKRKKNFEQKEYGGRRKEIDFSIRGYKNRQNATSNGRE